jgi:hypothetical protein
MQAWLQQLKNQFPCSNKIRVSKSSIFVCDGDLRKTHICIDGNNTVTIGKQTKMLKVELEITGENNRVMIGADCYFENDAPAKAAAFEDE